MRTPLPHKNSQSFNASGGVALFGNGSGRTQNSNGQSFKKKRSDYCWSFNKGVNCKFGKKCKFIERCSYCDNSSHGVYNCPKLDGKESTAKQKAGGKLTPEKKRI